MVICQGCGQGFALPAGYTRNKIQCPGCGVICAVPADADRAAAQAARSARQAPQAVPEATVEERAAAMLEDTPAAIPQAVPMFDDEPAPRPAKRQEMLVPCRRCGKKIRRQRECPNCDGPVEEREEPAGVGSLELDDPPRPIDADEVDDSPYAFSDKELPTCPQCRKDMPRGAVLCAACGFDTRTRRKVEREYVPVERTWDADMSLQTRVTIAAAAEGLYLVTAAVAALIAGLEPWGLVCTWVMFTAMLCFVLGTYDRITLTRTRKGRTKVTKQWRAFFVPLAPVTTDVHGFEGVTTGTWHDAGFLEWLVCINLLPLGLIPAVIYWYNAIYKPHFHVALALDHGHSEVYVYRGRSEEQMNDIADALANASGLNRLA
jgi:hypothetical protein